MSYQNQLTIFHCRLLQVMSDYHPQDTTGSSFSSLTQQGILPWQPSTFCIWKAIITLWTYYRKWKIICSVRVIDWVTTSFSRITTLSGVSLKQSWSSPFFTVMDTNLNNMPKVPLIVPDIVQHSNMRKLVTVIKQSTVTVTTKMHHLHTNDVSKYNMRHTGTTKSPSCQITWQPDTGNV